MKYQSKACLLIVGGCHVKYDVNKYISFPAIHQNKQKLSGAWLDNV